MVNYDEYSSPPWYNIVLSLRPVTIFTVKWIFNLNIEDLRLSLHQEVSDKTLLKVDRLSTAVAHFACGKVRYCSGKCFHVF